MYTCVVCSTVTVSLGLMINIIRIVTSVLYIITTTSSSRLVSWPCQCHWQSIFKIKDTHWLSDSLRHCITITVYVYKQLIHINYIILYTNKLHVNPYRNTFPIEKIHNTGFAFLMKASSASLSQYSMTDYSQSLSVNLQASIIIDYMYLYITI